jgi:hypothetical protein
MPYFDIKADGKTVSIQADDIIAAYTKSLDLDIIKNRQGPMFSIIESNPPQQNEEFFYL